VLVVVFSIVSGSPWVKGSVSECGAGVVVVVVVVFFLTFCFPPVAWEVLSAPPLGFFTR